MTKKKEPKQKKIENNIYNIIMFALIFALVISFVFTVDKLFFEKPIDNCYQAHAYSKPMTPEQYSACDYNQEQINECAKNGGHVIQNTDCTITCDYCYKEQSMLYQKYEDKLNYGRLILSFILALVFAFITIKDKIIGYSLLTASLVALFISTISAIRMLDNWLPIVIIAEFALVVFIYFKTSKRELSKK